MDALKLTMTARVPLEHLQGRTAQLKAAVSLRVNLQSVGLCLASVVLLSALMGCGAALPVGPEADARRAAQERYAKAKALFEERCKTAGVVIKRRVKDVEGIELLKVRPVLEWGDKRYFDPMFDGAAMAGEAQGERYIASLLYSELRNPNTPERRGVIQPPHVTPGMNQEAPRLGYSFVDVRNAASGELLRYKVVAGITDAAWRQRGGWAKDLEFAPIKGKPATYAVDYEDIVDPADRALWVAGTRIKIIDQRTGEVIAQLTRFVWDRGFGGSSTGRWPWQHASAQGGNECPREQSYRYLTRFFVETVLQPKQGE